MKPFFVFLCCFMATASVAFAQSEGAESPELLSRGDDVALSVGGFEFVFSKKKPRPAAPRVSSSLAKHVSYGFNTLVYSNFEDINANRSNHVSVDLYTVNFLISDNTTICVGLQYVYDDYVFSKNVSVATMEDGRIYSYPLDRQYKKSKIAANYLGIPLYLDYGFGGAKLSLSAYVNYLMSGFTKYRSPSVKQDFDGLNQIQVGCGIAVTYDTFGVFAQYGINSLFKEGSGPVAHRMSAGITFNF